MATYRWLFQKTPRMGGATGEAFVNTLHATGMSPDAVLAREAIQNSCDAANNPGKEKVRVVFRRIQLTGTQKLNFLREAGITDDIVSRAEQLELQSDHCVGTMNDPDIPLSLLYVEDYSTHGLYGDPHDDSSHFFRLLLSLGDGSKAREGKDSGGSYGFGKSVYSANSRIHTIFAYSVIAAEHVADGIHSRLMGCSYFNAHKHGGTSYSGRAWLGIKDGEDVDPLENDAAHGLAKTLGFSPRANQQSGTSILIVDCSVETEELKRSIEEWWWPRLVEDGLDVEIYEQDKRMPPPRPRQRSDLRPFIECYDLATKRANVAQPKCQKTGDLNRIHNTPLGSYGYMVLPPEALNDEALQEKLNCVALIRSPRMVVSYLETGSTAIPVIGTFVAAGDVDGHLKLSEPASHDRWDPKSTRLDATKDRAREFVRTIVDRLKAGLKAFARDALPPVPKSEIRPKLLEKLLGNLFKPPSKAPGNQGGSAADPITIRFSSQPHTRVDGDKLRTACMFKVGLNQDFAEATADVLLDVRCLVAEEDGFNAQDDIPVSLTCVDVDYEVVSEHPAMLKIKLDKEMQAQVEAISSPYDPNWTTQLKVQVSRKV